MPSAFGLRGLPTSWIVDRKGKILVRYHGEAVWDTDEVERFVRAVLSASPAPPTPARPAALATVRTTPRARLR